ncbi:OmpW/AlkL family protein [Oceanicoccus sagamiensis]|uniref:OmpW/AlkL family protein n=1 Tax=Oceanicoccus sagamiensis TaxID=716816 RepID=UPI001F0B36D4|nr:OmpW family outer membrane protein [Oceanicoccus sagamiensis]
MSALPLTVMGHQQGEWIARVGAATVDPDESSSLISVEALGGKVQDTGLGLNSDTQVGLTVAYMLTDNIAVELLAATPFDHDVYLTGSGIAGAQPGLPNGTKIASVEHLPPTLSLQYFPLDASSKIQPYAGIGINYTLVLDESLTSAIKADIADGGLAASNLDIDDSVGLSLQLGVDYQLDDTWLINAAVWKMDIETEASFDSAVGKVKADLDIDPWVYMVSIGYKF